jgi:hypothetical protein
MSKELVCDTATTFLLIAFGMLASQVPLSISATQSRVPDKVTIIGSGRLFLWRREFSFNLFITKKYLASC